MIRADGRKISEFPASVDVTGSEFTFVANGVNYKIAFSDLVPLLGATGSLIQAGDVLAAPILDQNGSVNGIRNIENGSGIAASVSPSNGVKVSHNFTVSETGVPLMTGKTLPSPTIRSLVAGPGINIAGAGDNVQIAVSGTPVSTRTVIINQLSDFPDPVGNIITLGPDTQYLIYNSINVGTLQFRLNDNTSIEGSNATVVSLDYTGTDDMFIAEEANVRFGLITLNAPNGRIIRFKDNSLTKTIYFIDMGIDLCKEIMLFESGRAFLFELASVVYTTKGITITGTVDAFCAVLTSNFGAGAGPLLDISGATLVNAVAMSTSFIALLSPSSSVIKGVGSANIGTLSTVFNVRTTNPGGGAFLDGVSVNDNKWRFALNDGMLDSAPVGLISLQNNITQTVIASTNTPVLIAGTWSINTASMFTCTAAGRITCDSVRPVAAAIDATASVFMAAGTDLVTLRLYINGVSVETQQGQATTSNPANLSILWHRQLQPGDYVELWIENDGSSVDLVVREAQLRVFA